MALKEESLSPWLFTSVRLIAGALALSIIQGVQHLRSRQMITKANNTKRNHRLLPAAALFVYALAFAFAYLELETGSGALILFASVQVTMFLLLLIKERKIPWEQLIAMFGAVIGLSYFLSASSPGGSITGAILMMLSGVAWGFYTVLGRGSKLPLQDAKSSFLIAAISICIISIPYFVFFPPDTTMSLKALLIALSAGAFTSGLGYAIWYAILPQIKTGTAALMQLTVPLIAAFLGFILLGEALSQRFTLAAIIILASLSFPLIVQSARKR